MRQVRRNQPEVSRVECVYPLGLCLPGAGNDQGIVDHASAVAGFGKRFDRRNILGRRQTDELKPFACMRHNLRRI